MGQLAQTLESIESIISPEKEIHHIEKKAADSLPQEERAKEQELDHDHDIHRLRKEYLPKIYKLIIFYLCIVGFILLLNMHPNISIWFIKLQFVRLSDKVLITLLTTTTANVLGIFYIVTKWLFPTPKRM